MVSEPAWSFQALRSEVGVSGTIFPLLAGMLEWGPPCLTVSVSVLCPTPWWVSVLSSPWSQPADLAMSVHDPWRVKVDFIHWSTCSNLFLPPNLTGEPLAYVAVVFLTALQVRWCV